MLCQIKLLSLSRLITINRFLFLRLLMALIVASFSGKVNGQLCNGSLGDPVVNITFGSGISGSSSVYTATNSYTLFGDCPNDGYYTITNHSPSCFGNTWHIITSDHTGGGGFLLVNATFTPGDFFVTTVTDLCPNTTYEFASWLMNVVNRVNSIKPNITFSIETPGGVVLQTLSTGDIPVTPTPEWKQYGLFFTTPAVNAVIVLRMTNNAPGGNGNDIALDDITFRPCGFKVNAAIAGNVSDTVNVCEGNTNTYTFNSSVAAGYISPLYQWQVSMDMGSSWKNIPGATAFSFQRNPTLAPGNYWYRFSVIEASVATISSCRIASNIVAINVHPKPTVDAGPDRVVLTGGSATLAAIVAGEQPVYSWSPNNSINDITLLQPTVIPANDIVYTLSATSAFGCFNKDDVQVKVVSGIYVPTAFTPNGDGKNDDWKIPFLDPSFGGDVKVFNRYGQLVYHTESAVVSWDGKLKGVAQPAGTYVYLVTFKTNALKLKGTITLIR